MFGDEESVNVGFENKNKINLCMELGKVLDMSFGWKDPRNFMIQNFQMVKFGSEQNLKIIILMNHYEGCHLITPDKLLYEIENLMLFEPTQPIMSDFPFDHGCLSNNIFQCQLNNVFDFMNN